MPTKLRRGTMDINLSNGETLFDCILAVENRNGTNGEYGFRLCWVTPDLGHAVPALGLATSSPFRTTAHAVRYAIRHFGQRPKLLTRSGLRTI